MPQRPYDERLLRQAFEVARKARDAGSSPTKTAMCCAGNPTATKPEGATAPLMPKGCWPNGLRRT